MSDAGRKPPPKHFGDSPHGAYWSAEAPADSLDDGALDVTVTGNVIRFMWDYGVEVPLWTDEGLVPGEPEWLRVALGLSDALIRDLSDWGHAMNDLDGRAIVPEQAYRDLDRRAHQLVGRLQNELDPRFTVVYKPWVDTYLP